MAGAFIRLGDATSHGGVVVGASTQTDSGGIPVARVGDMATCPLCKPGIFPIVSGDNSLIVEGKAVARNGDKIACGAALIASQNATIDLI
ncbi:MAG: PAAR domain-containing protein [Methylococcaceae bacterium]|jgi:uncharacterized Zn-binding protein involved in type VI secretion